MPVIVMTLNKVEATAKENVRLVSTVTGEPEPSVEWLVNQLTTKAKLKTRCSTDTLFSLNRAPVSAVFEHYIQ